MIFSIRPLLINRISLLSTFKYLLLFSCFFKPGTIWKSGQICVTRSTISNICRCTSRGPHEYVTYITTFFSILISEEINDLTPFVISLNFENTLSLRTCSHVPPFFFIRFLYLIYPARVGVCVQFVRTYATATRTWDSSTFCHIDRGRKGSSSSSYRKLSVWSKVVRPPEPLVSLCSSYKPQILIYFLMNLERLAYFCQRMKTMQNGSHRAVFSNISHITPNFVKSLYEYL